MASQVRLTVRMGDVHIFYNMGLRGQPRYILRSSSYSFPRFAFLSAGAVDKLVLPEGMQSVGFYRCYGLTGTAKLEISDGHILFYLYVFGGQQQHVLHSSFSHFPSPSILPFSQGISGS